MVHQQLAAALLSIFMAWPSSWYPKEKAPETAEQREQRMSMSTGVVSKVSLDNETGFHVKDAATLISMTWKWESGNLEYFVHAGGESPIGHQDHGNAVCLGQIQTWPNNKHLPTKADHKALAGTTPEATERCARVTLNYMWGHAQRCLRTTRRKEVRWAEPLADWEVAKLAAAYGAGKCAPVAKRHKNRAYTFRKIRKSLDAVK
jgi:hypothetical protein